jgi:hypothetical protein
MSLDYIQYVRNTAEYGMSRMLTLLQSLSASHEPNEAAMVPMVRRDRSARNNVRNLAALSEVPGDSSGKR